MGEREKRLTLRGFGGNLIVVEEVLFVKEDVIKSVIAPVFGKDGTKLVALSSPEVSQDNGFSLALQKHGEVFKTIHITYVCKPCNKLGITTICKHCWLDVPKWCTPDSLRVAKALMGDDETTFARENLGLVVDGGKNVFSPIQLDKIWGRPGISLTEYADFVFISCDPCAGSGEPENNISDFAIVSYVCNPKVIVGLDRFPSNSHMTFMPRLYAHIEKLQKQEYMKHAVFVIDYESNSSSEVSFVYEHCQQRFPGLIIGFHLKPNSQVLGSRIQTQDKREMVHIAQQYVNEKSIFILDNYVTTDPKSPNRTGPNSAEAQELYQQALRFDRLVTVGKNGFVSDAVKFSGKAGGSKKDDLVMTWLRVMYVARCFFGNQYYAKYWYRRNPYEYQEDEQEIQTAAATLAAAASPTMIAVS